MKKTILSLTLLFFAYTITWSQLGLSVGYANFNVPEWEKAIGAQEARFDAPLFKLASRVGINYRLPLEKVRIEFLPSIEYVNSRYSFPNLSSLGNEVREGIDLNIWGAYLNTKVYPFSFKADCTCPTFHQGGKAFEKGFFLMTTFGAEQVTSDFYTVIDKEETSSKVSDLTPIIGGGIGFDIGLSRFITLSPLVHIRYNGKLDGMHLLRNTPSEPLLSNAWQAFGGINVVLHFHK
jgi:hypothetical protein